MDLLGIGHVSCAVLAMGTGGFVLLDRKGTPRHRAIGRVYAAAMILTNASALMIYDLFGGFGPFHVAALISLATVIPGVIVARRKRKGWLEAHYFWMTFSYVGLMAAFVSETLTRVPSSPFWGSVLIGTLAVFAVGSRLIYGNAHRVRGRDSI